MTRRIFRGRRPNPTDRLTLRDSKAQESAACGRGTVDQGLQLRA